MFKTNNSTLSFLPSTNANHIQYNVPIFLACERKLMCLYDSDPEGNKELEKLADIFGEEIKNIAFKTSEIDSSIKETEDLYDQNECQNVQKTVFGFNDHQLVETKKLIKQIFFAPNRQDILDKMPITKNNISRFIGDIENKFDSYYRKKEIKISTKKETEESH